MLAIERCRCVLVATLACAPMLPNDRPIEQAD
jgi:hypothetical protein